MLKPSSNTKVRFVNKQLLGSSFTDLLSLPNLKLERDSAPTPMSHSLAGLGSGVIGAFIVGPFEAVKVKMQINRTRAGLAPSTWQTAKDIVTKEGVIDGIVR